MTLEASRTCPSGLPPGASPGRRHRGPWRNGLPLATPEQQRLFDCIESALDSASEGLVATSATGCRFRLRGVALGTLAEASEDSLSQTVSADVIAGVVQRFEGRLNGTALLALDPAEALAWLETGAHDEDPLRRFVDLGGCVLGEVVAKLAHACEAHVEPGPCLLEERPLLTALLSTHAPSDTALLSVDGELEFSSGEAVEPTRIGFSIQLLLEPKLLAGVLMGLVEHPESAE